MLRGRRRGWDGVRCDGMGWDGDGVMWDVTGVSTEQISRRQQSWRSTTTYEQESEIDAAWRVLLIYTLSNACGEVLDLRGKHEPFDFKSRRVETPRPSRDTAVPQVNRRIDDRAGAGKGRNQRSQQKTNG